MKAITVCVDFDDILSLTLPVNGRHFSEYLVVTAPDDDRTHTLVDQINEVFDFNVKIHATDAFFRRKAKFNKGLAIEEAFDAVGREGWICVLDADIVIPDTISLRFPVNGTQECQDIWISELPSRGTSYPPGMLYTPHRVCCDDIKEWRGSADPKDWKDYRLYNDYQHAGYFQIFHASDRVLDEKPWYGVDWTHAGGGDSDFQAKWPKERKVWLPFHVLHLGPMMKNWCGRATDRLDGEIELDSGARYEAVQEIQRQRKKTGGYSFERL